MESVVARRRDGLKLGQGRALWKLKPSPTVSIVQETWLNYVEAQTPWITDDLSRFSPNQRNILAAIAYNRVTEPFSQEFSNRVKISTSSIRKSLNILLRDDFVYQDEKGQYLVLDPAIETHLHKIKSFDFLEE